MDDLEADDSGVKFAIPCLEPCALMLKFAHGVFRFEQHNGPINEMTEEDQRNLLLAAELAAELAAPWPRGGLRGLCKPTFDPLSADAPELTLGQTACPLGQAELFCALRGCEKTEGSRPGRCAI